MSQASAPAGPPREASRPRSGPHPAPAAATAFADAGPDTHPDPDSDPDAIEADAPGPSAGASPIDAAQLDMDSALHAAELGAYGTEPSLPKLLRFGVVGVLGFVWDTGTVYLARPLVGLTLAVLLAFLVAATANFAVNRIWTFRSTAHGVSIVRQWALYLIANSLGFVLNRTTVFTLIAIFPLCARAPVLPLAVGAGASLLANFSLSRRFVFRGRAR